MKGRTIAITLVSLMLLGVLALCGLTFFGTYRWAQARGINLNIRRDNASSQVTEKQTFPVQDNLSLDVTNTLGDVSVSAVPGIKEVVIEVTKTGWGANDTEAKAAADGLAVEMRQEGSKVIADFSPAEPNELTFGTYRSPHASFNIQVPPETDVTIRTTSGDLNLAGITGKTTLDCYFGDLTVRDVQGELTINGGSANVNLNNIQAGNRPVYVQSSFGNITIDGIGAGKITVENSNGSVQLSNVKSGDSISLKSSFAPIELANLTSPTLDIVNENGAVILTSSTIDGLLNAEASFEKIDLSDVHADGYHLVNQNGSIYIDEAQGPMELSSSFGEIQITHAEDAVLKIRNENGKVSFSGSLKEGSDQSIETSMDDIDLSLPASTAADLDITTTGGTIQSELPVTLFGGLTEDSWTGQLNNGGSMLHIQNQNGSVKIEKLK